MTVAFSFIPGLATPGKENLMQASIGTSTAHQHAPAPFYAGDFDDVTRSAQRQLARNLAISGGTMCRRPLNF